MKAKRILAYMTIILLIVLIILFSGCSKKIQAPIFVNDTIIEEINQNDVNNDLNTNPIISESNKTQKIETLEDLMNYLVKQYDADKRLSRDMKRGTKDYEVYRNKDLNFAIYNIKNPNKEIITYQQFFDFAYEVHTNSIELVKEEYSPYANQARLNYEIIHQLKDLGQTQSEGITESFYIIYSGGKSISKTQMQNSIFLRCTKNLVVKIEPKLGFGVDNLYLVDRDQIYKNFEETNAQLIGKEIPNINAIKKVCDQSQTLQKTYERISISEKIEIPYDSNPLYDLSITYTTPEISRNTFATNRWQYYISDDFMITIYNSKEAVENAYINIVATADDKKIVYNETDHKGLYYPQTSYIKRILGTDFRFIDHLTIKTTVYSLNKQGRKYILDDEHIIHAPINYTESEI